MQEIRHELYEYDGILFLETSPDETTRRVRDFVTAFEFKPVDLNGNTIEVRYTGRDTDRWFVSWLEKLANVVRDAQGEISCTITTEEGDPLFEFFRIAEGKL